MIYIVRYKNRMSEEIKIAQVEAEDIREANDKVESIFKTLESVGDRKYILVDLTALHEIRKLDMFD